MKAFEAYKLYNAIHLHFTTGYDFFKYNGKTRVTKETFLYKERSKYHYGKLAEKYGYTKTDLIKFLIFVFSRYDIKWIGEVFDKNIEKSFLHYTGFVDSFSYNIPKELQEVLEGKDLKPLFRKNQDIGLPHILYLYLKNKISIETIIILDIASGNKMIDPYWKKKYGNDPLFKKFYQTQAKLRGFYSISYKRSREILKDFLVKSECHTP